MDLSKPVVVIIAVFVGVLVTATILVPVIDNYTEETKTATNEGTPFMLFDGETHTYIVSVDGEGAVSITLDGESCPVPDTSLYGSATMIYGTDGFVRLGSTGNVRPFVTSYPSSFVPTVDSPITIVISSDGDITVNENNTYAIGTKYIVAPSGDYVQSVNPVVIEDSEISVAGTTSYGSQYISFIGEGTIAEFDASTLYSNVGSGVSVTSVDTEVITSEVNGDLVRIDNIKFTATLSNDTVKVGNYTFMVAPKTITYDNPTYLDNGTYTALLLVIPVLLFLVCALLAVRAISGRAD